MEQKSANGSDAAGAGAAVGKAAGTEPRETTVIRLCMGSSCFSRGNRDNLSLIRRFLRERGLDGVVEVKGGLCRGTCGTGPHLDIDGTTYDGVDQQVCLDLLNRVFGR